jgi:hypothetical protein
MSSHSARSISAVSAGATGIVTVAEQIVINDGRVTVNEFRTSGSPSPRLDRARLVPRKRCGGARHNTELLFSRPMSFASPRDQIARSIVIPLTLSAMRSRRAAFHQEPLRGASVESSCKDGTQMPEKQNARIYPGEEVRQGEIILRKPWMRVVFIAGLVGCVLLALGIRIAAGPS